ncbi:unnamed protein product [Symbiodinium natans]|uniref:Uncharacterized protein n=1 Tax=Symbiodinium natans TaxID=878477 RepID=A0A812NMM9_9DINO|nr:unnamed protein product [Symbiodinium natans]
MARAQQSVHCHICEILRTRAASAVASKQKVKRQEKGRGKLLVGGGLILTPLLGVRPLRRLEPKLRALPGGAARQLLHLRPNGRRVPPPRLSLWR